MHAVFVASPSMLNRRDILALAGSAAALQIASTANPSVAQAQSRMQELVKTTMGSGKSFSRQAVLSVARELAKRPYAAPNVPLPDPFNGLNAEQYAAITTKPETALWANDGRGLTIEPLHRGFVFDVPVLLYTVEDSVVLNVSYDRNRFNFGKLVPPGSLPDMGYSGFRVMLQEDGKARDLAVFQGATFFRSQAKGQQRGLVARAVSIKTADARGEEISLFRAFWIEKPPIGGPLVVHAIADSESLVAAIRFTIRPGDVTIIDCETTLIPRVPVDHVGLGGMQAMHFFSPGSPRRAVDDYRPAAHEATGLQMLRGNGEWVWRQLTNPAQLQISTFQDENIRGFGLVQRDRDFEDFQDDDQRYQIRPSCWVEPIGEWGKGAIQLVEIPIEADVNQNIVSYWRPRATLASNEEAIFNFRQYWCWQIPENIGLATTQMTRIGRIGNKRRRFVVDFAGDTLTPEKKAADFKIALSLS
ncbi:MAG: glucan biosynthesis protein, partial [Beijerinckiaceae bacterium]|nr:glucan biosynthesis protein [Beijerinckiaceae bacterium]